MRALIALLPLCFGGLVYAQDDVWLKRSEDILRKSAIEALLPAPNTDARHVREAERIMRETRGSQALRKLQGAGSQPAARAALPPDQPQVIFFASTAMPEALLKDMISEASRWKAPVLLRGVLPGKSIHTSFVELARLWRESEAKAPVQINPLAFKEHGISSVPTMLVKLNGQSIQVRGELNVRWAIERLKSGRTGDQGKWGQTYEIAEEDMVDTVRTRMAAIDWAQKKDEAVGRFWGKQTFVDLPEARVERRYLFDPTVRISKDVHDGQGRLLAAKGQQINVQSILPLSKRIIAFDGSSPRQRQIVAQWVKRTRSQGRGVLLMTSRVDVTDGWRSIKAISEQVGGRVFLLNQQIVDRFQIERLPTLIESAGDKLAMTELGVGEPVVHK